MMRASTFLPRLHLPRTLLLVAVLLLAVAALFNAPTVPTAEAQTPPQPPASTVRVSNLSETEAGTNGSIGSTPVFASFTTTSGSSEWWAVDSVTIEVKSNVDNLSVQVWSDNNGVPGSQIGFGDLPYFGTDTSGELAFSAGLFLQGGTTYWVRLAKKTAAGSDPTVGRTASTAQTTSYGWAIGDNVVNAAGTAQWSESLAFSVSTRGVTARGAHDGDRRVVVSWDEVEMRNSPHGMVVIVKPSSSQHWFPQVLHVPQQSRIDNRLVFTPEAAVRWTGCPQAPWYICRIQPWPELRNGVSYDVRIAPAKYSNVSPGFLTWSVFNESGYDWSNTLTVTPQAEPRSSLPAPQNVRVTPRDGGAIVEWDAVAGAGGYTLTWAPEGRQPTLEINGYPRRTDATYPTPNTFSVSNLGETRTSNGDVQRNNGALFASFTTGGSTSDSLSFRDVTIPVGANGDRLEVEIWSSDASGDPDAKLGSALSRLGLATTGDVTYIVDGLGTSPTLVGGTTYFVRIHEADPASGNDPTVGRTTSANQTGSDGWSIGDSVVNASGTDVWGESLAFSVTIADGPPGGSPGGGDLTKTEVPPVTRAIAAPPGFGPVPGDATPPSVALSNGVRYWFKVTAHPPVLDDENNPTGELGPPGADSAPAFGIPHASPTPVAPTTWVGIDDGYIAVHWNQYGDPGNATEYEVQMSTSSQADASNFDNRPAGTQYVKTRRSHVSFSGLVNGVTRFFAVRALNGTLKSPAAEFSATAAARPAAPSLLSAVPGPGDGEVTLTWAPPTDTLNRLAVTGWSAEALDLERNSDGGLDRHYRGPFSARSPSAVFSGLTPGREYSFVIKARAVAGTGPAAATLFRLSPDSNW